MPFSDPMADGPTIQRSSERALARGAGLRYVFDGVRAFRERDDDTPVVLMGYLNPVEIRGAERFAARSRRRPASMACCWSTCRRRKPAEFRDAFAAHGLALILLASPTTTRRAPGDACARHAQGYLYYVSFAGVTGAGPPRYRRGRGAPAHDLRAAAAVPVVAGFGIKDAASAAAMAADADGVVVGSALVAALADAGDPDDAAARAAAFLAPLRAALDALTG